MLPSKAPALRRLARPWHPLRHKPAHALTTQHGTCRHASTGPDEQPAAQDAAAPQASPRKRPRNKAAAAATTPPRQPSPGPPPAIAPGSPHHHDLPSFLAYANRANLAPSTTAYVGTHYEYTVAAALAPLGLALTRTGRTRDLGIDLLGTWAPPSAHTPLRVLAQCKASAPQPAHVRELEGAVVGAPAGWRGEGVLALLVARRGATRGCREAVSRSRLAMGFVTVGVEGTVRQIVWNQRAAAMGLEGLGVVVRHRDKGGEPQGQEGEQEVTLMWEGRPWPITREHTSGGV